MCDRVRLAICTSRWLSPTCFGAISPPSLSPGCIMGLASQLGSQAEPMSMCPKNILKKVSCISRGSYVTTRYLPRKRLVSAPKKPHLFRILWGWACLCIGGRRSCRARERKTLSQPKLQCASVMRTSTARHTFDYIDRRRRRVAVIGLLTEELVLHSHNGPPPALSRRHVTVVIFQSKTTPTEK